MTRVLCAVSQTEDTPLLEDLWVSGSFAKNPLTSVWAVGNALLCAGVRGLNLLLVLNGCVMGDWNVLFLLKSSKSEVSLFP